MRQFFRNRFLDLIGPFNRPTPGIHILNGHILGRENANPDIFRRLLHQLQSDTHLIRIEEAVNRIIHSDIPEEPYVGFTFDDGFEEQYTEIAVVLEEFGINAAFFILPGFTNGSEEFRDDLYSTVFRQDRFLNKPKPPMTWDQIRDLQQKGHIIGSHGFSHVKLNTHDPDILQKELVASKEIIKEKTGTSCEYLAFPFGGINDLSTTALEIAQQEYKFIFSQSNYAHYFSYNKAVINRRHFEPFWPLNHIKYFLSVKRQY